MVLDWGNFFIAAAIALLVLVVVVSLVSLIPHQPPLALGIETGVFGLGAVALVKGGIGLVPALALVVSVVNAWVVLVEIRR